MLLLSLASYVLARKRTPECFASMHQFCGTKSVLRNEHKTRKIQNKDAIIDANCFPFMKETCRHSPLKLLMISNNRINYSHKNRAGLTKCDLLSWLHSFGDGSHNNKKAVKSDILDDVRSSTKNEHSQKPRRHTRRDNKKKSDVSGLTKTAGSVAAMMEEMNQAQEMKLKTASLLEELSHQTIVGFSSSSKIKLYVDGQLRPTGVEIDDEEFLLQDREQLANEILSAIQDARNKYEDNISEKVKTLSNNFDINYNYDVNDHSHNDLWM